MVRPACSRRADSSSSARQKMLSQYANVFVRSDPRASASQELTRQWGLQACPFEETRHSCYFVGQSNASEIAAASAQLAKSVQVESVLRALAGRRVIFVGDSVLRQLMQATMCRLRLFLLRDDLVWQNPMQRRHPSLNYKGVCPFERAKHCELRTGCAKFKLNATVPVTVCYSNAGFQVGWAVLRDEFVRSGADVVIFNTGHHHPPETQVPMWDGAAAHAARKQLLAAAQARGARLVLQEYEPQRKPPGDLNLGPAIGVRQQSTYPSHARLFVCHGCRFSWRAEWRLRHQIAPRQGGLHCLRAPELDERSTPGRGGAQQATGHARTGDGPHRPVAELGRGRGATDARTLESSVVGSLACCTHRLRHARLHTLVHARYPGRVGNHAASSLDVRWPRHKLSDLGVVW
jgi:hypothetical protein